MINFFVLTCILFYFFFPLVFAGIFQYNMEAQLYITVAAMSFILPIIAVQHLVKGTNGKLCYSKSKYFKWISLSLLFFSCIGIVSTVSNSNLQTSNFSIGLLNLISAENAGRRYSNEISVTFIAKIGLISLYINSSILGMTLAFRKKYFVDIAHVISSLSMAFLLGSKGIILYCCVLYVANLLTVLSINIDKIKTLSILRFAQYGALALFATYVLFILFRSARYSYSIFESMQQFSGDYFSYAFGHLSGFHSFFLAHIQSSNTHLQLGTQTFQGVFNIFGASVPNNYVLNIKEIGSGYTTNVDTVLRDFLVDFGVFGSFGVFLLLGLTFAIVGTPKSPRRELLVFRVAILTGILWSFTNSIFTYELIVLTLAINGAFFNLFLTWKR